MEGAEVILPPCMIPQISSPVLGQNIDPIESPTVKACPWGKSPIVESVSFSEVMSEQLATALNAEEHAPIEPTVLDAANFVETGTSDDLIFAQMLQREYDKDRDPIHDTKHEPTVLDAAASFVKTNTSDDLLLAQMLQREYDKEHDTILKNEEKKFNGDSKVTVSFGKYLRLPFEEVDSDDDEEQNEYILEQHAKKHWHNFEQAEKVLHSVGKTGVSRQGNVTTTKHDPAMWGRRNVCRLMEFSSGIDSGDPGQFDMKLSNNVYNTLKLHSIAEDKRNNKVHDKKEKATAESAVDEKTRLILYKLVNSEVIESVNGCISTGKEACIYHAMSGETNPSAPPNEFALKVFKTTLNEFQNRDQYIRDDYRFRDRFGRLNPRKIIHLWAEKEMRNLIRIKKANIPCPDVVALKKHVLVMSFIGSNFVPAPKLKEVKVPFEDLTIMYEQTIEIMKKLYQECQLVHADLSEYNLLWHDGKVWVIDVSQGVEITHPQALHFLYRDCRNVSSFFEKKGVVNVLRPETLYTEICGKALKL